MNQLPEMWPLNMCSILLAPFVFHDKDSKIQLFPNLTLKASASFFECTCAPIYDRPERKPEYGLCQDMSHIMLVSCNPQQLRSYTDRTYV